MTMRKNGIERRRWRESGWFLLALLASFVCVFLATSLALYTQPDRDIPAKIRAQSTANYREVAEAYFEPVDIAILSELTADTGALFITPENRSDGTKSPGTPDLPSITSTHTLTPTPIETDAASPLSPTPTRSPTSLPSPTTTLHPSPTATSVPPTATPNPPTSTPLPPTAVPPTKTPKPQPQPSAPPAATATLTATPTTTATATNGIFVSATPTPSSSPTATSSSTPPATPTPVPTITNTPPPSSVPSATSTLTPTTTGTLMSSSTPSATSTLTPAATATPTPSSTPTYTPTPSPAPVYQPIIPIFVCHQDNGDGTFTAYFGYQNLNAYTVNIPVGNGNRFTPPPEDRGQPTDFLPGIVSPAVAVVYDGAALLWHLDGTNEAAGNTPCP